MAKVSSALKFNKNIIPSVQDSLSSNELIDRLGKLHEELSSLEQGHTNLRSLNNYKADLINKKLIKSKDPGIQAFAACCLSDILRLYAPDAPYTDTELTDIFKLFINQFKLLADPDNGYYIQQTYLITRLLEYRSIVLLTDLDSSKLIDDVFQVFYDKQRNTFQPKLSKIIGSLLGEIISECESVSMSVLRTIFNKFLTHDFGTRLKPLQSATKDPAFEFSLTICQSYSNRLGRHFTKFYSEILYGITNSDSGGSSSGNGGHSLQSTLDPSFKTLTKLHRLTANIWEYVPELISSVIGFVHQELCSDNVPLRIGATRLVGDILSVTSDINFIKTHKDTYKAWLSKIADINANVRREWVKSLPKVMSVRTDIAEDIDNGLTKTLMDTDDLVRLSSVETFNEIPVEKMWVSFKDPILYTQLCQLTREKNKNIREVCIEAVANFYVDSINHIERKRETEALWKVVDSIPSVLFNLYYINDPNINFQVDTVIFEKIFPLQPDDVLRINRLITILKHFDQKAFSSFCAFNRRQIQMCNALLKFIEFCDAVNSDAATENIKDKLGKTIDWFVSGLPTQLDCKAIFEKFIELNDKRIYHLIKICVARDVRYSTMKNSITELFTRLKDEDLFKKKNVRIGSSFTRDTFQSVFKILIYRSAPLIYNVSTIPLLIDNVGDHKELELKRQLIEQISTVNPTVFKDQIDVLKEIINRLDDPGTSSEEAMPISEALKTIYKISKSLKDSFDTSDDFFTTRLKDFAIDGTPEEAKYAVKLLSLSPERRNILTSIKTQILPLDLNRSKNFASHITVLAQMFKIEPQLLDDDSGDIVSYLIRHVLLANQVLGNSKKENAWVTDTQLNEIQYQPLSSKLYSLKLFTNKLRSISDVVNTDEVAQAFTEKTMKLFFYLLASGGELIAESNKDNYPTPNNYQTKLRCFAGLQVLKIARIPNFNRFILPTDVMKLVNLVEDESLEVRQTFVDQLRNYISSEYISIKFLPLVFFMAYEPSAQLKQNIKTWINFTFAKGTFQKGTFFERALPRLIHCIAHHPDVLDGINEKGDAYLNSITTSIDYLIFYFDSVATTHNICLLYYLAGRVKQYQDSVNEEDSESDEVEQQLKAKNIYIISELTQLILTELKNQRGWNIPVYPGKLNLPSDLFQPFPSMEEAQRNTFISYLPEAQLDSLKGNVKGKVSRMSHSSHTIKQQVQKRKLASEYQKPHTTSVGAKRKKKSSENYDEEATPEKLDDYRPRSKNANAANPTRKSARQRRDVNYQEDEDEKENEEYVV
ncbi:sister chromatid cohesion factor PDS5 Ecym_7247 [Eremothecium cymbalariae DBVPG|uniref:Sister chromatid cohesion protein n=1 Tax=Eremothecium cymbalariae (strain CBS 270.75 / DBVPG 7215 / KCTC 17166 / NRRL Y-17582) TaxID=931890 RepID=G8JW76_ERECY|nr:hypothetical protein Ecym_7247 [Eremothecium cymbalariae DBVPG\